MSTVDSMTSFNLSNGMSIPSVGFGTYKVGYTPTGERIGRDGKDVIIDAIKAGYRLFDCASFYGNEKVVGDGLIASGVPRKDLFIVSKVWPDKVYLGHDAIIEQCKKTLKDLQTSYLDLYLIHWPVPGKFVEAYRTLQELQQSGLVKAIGLSNFTIEDYEELMASPGVRVEPVVNQIEINPLIYRKKTIEYFQSKGMTLLSWRGLGKGVLFDDPRIMTIAQELDITPSQVIGRWLIQHHIVHIPKTQNVDRMNNNRQLFSFSLNDDQMSVIDSFGLSDDVINKFKQDYMSTTVKDTPLSLSNARQQFTCE
ncbi:aldo-keto reductase, putative [Perkinsus marinus ATCC 50983]|uniref:Aldo-keto reductase, putative n=1 Tax=Perkinsus marinus (strain ATCC 50983 / TXsc) TaxID=423536 RepID=C5LTF7_PERM5|nr:aldo-keto reductase, putative [Perkinsus marinus ATCC 50983]EER00125.1 aldo-keto reductase, putative [Perkinsus marinus ATCC 50983]|eukprot:XP_002767407.1 aldo-keto reductase, putative [Perkinsus marinus ATCC 50983]